MAAVKIIERAESSIKGHCEYNCIQPHIQPHFLSQKCLVCSVFVLTCAFFLSYCLQFGISDSKFLLQLLTILNCCQTHIYSSHIDD